MPIFIAKTIQLLCPRSYSTYSISMNEQKWEKELLDFCQSYEFENANGGVLGVLLIFFSITLKPRVE